MAYPLSYSRANAFDECPAKFKAQYIEHRGGGVPEPHLIVGSVVHEVCDQYVGYLKERGLASSFAELDKVFERVWASDIREGLSEAAKPEVYELLLIAREMLIFADISRVRGNELKLAVDKDWKPIDYDSPKAWVRGKIDRLDMDDEGNTTVVDYKSGYRIVGVQDSWQIKLYARLVRAHYPEIEVMDVQLAYIRHRSVRHGRVGLFEMDAAQAWIEGVRVDMDKAAKSGRYPARPGAPCRGCAAFKDCAARSVTVKPVPPEDETAAVDLVRRLVLIERERKEIMEAITPFVDQYGDVEANGMVLGYVKENRLEFDVARVATILEKRGLRPLRYMKVDTNEIRKLGRMDSKLAEELEKSAKPADITKLKLVLNGEDQ